jgi:membrane-associated phospholipid phosphatase
VTLIALPLGGALFYYSHYRRQPNFVLCLSALLQIVLFSTAFVLLTYLGARTARPLADRQLAACDAALGLDVSQSVASGRRHPMLGRLLNLAYDSMLLQTAIVVALLGLRGDCRLEIFTLRFTVSALIALALFLVLPAEGPFSTYGFRPSASQSHYLEHLHALRDGTFTFLNFADVAGLVAFPSFHSIWALLLILTCRQQRIISVVVLILNSLVIIATLTTGWHYLTDVLGGVVVCGIVCLVITGDNRSSDSNYSERAVSDHQSWLVHHDG